MDIQEFLQLTSGNWFSQRTSYHLTAQETDNSKADLAVELLSQDDQGINKLCQSLQIQTSNSLGAIKVSWDNSPDWGKTKEKGFSTIVLIPNTDNPAEGKLIKQNLVTPINLGRYILGKDEVLTLIIEDETNYLEERQWFASDNLRLRTILAKGANRVTYTSFYSEIRKAPKP